MPMVKLAIKRGLHFEITYSPLIGDINSRRQMLVEAKLLVDWTKGKNLIISSAAHTTNEIRGPYDVINLCVYLLGLSMERAKAAISINCRSLIAKALRKKHFYKETIRIERLLPNEQLNSKKFLLGDWIGWDPISCEGDVQSMETNLEPPQNKNEPTNSPMDHITCVVRGKPNIAAVCPLAKELEQSPVEKEIPGSTSEEMAQADRGVEILMEGRLCTSLTCLDPQSIARGTILDMPRNMEVVMAHSGQPGIASSVDLKTINEHVEFYEYSMQTDSMESHKCNIIARDDSSFSPDVCLEDKGLEQSSVIPDDIGVFKNYVETMECTPGERDGQAPQDYGIPLGSDVCLEDKDPDRSIDILDDTEACRDIEEVMECTIGGRDDHVPLNHAVCASNFRGDDVSLEQVTEEKVEQIDETGGINRRTTPNISKEQTLHDQETSSTAFVDDKGSNDAAEKSQLKEQNSTEVKASVEKDTAKVQGEIQNGSSTNDMVELSTIKSEKQRHKLTSRHPTYVPFLGFLKPMAFKKAVRKRRHTSKPI